MAHQIESTNDIAFSGETPWHSLGNRIDGKCTPEEAARKANLNFTVVRVPAFAGSLPGAQYGQEKEITDTGVYFNRRSDNGRILGTQTHTDRRVEVQPCELLEFVWRYIGVDDRFEISCLGNIRGGEQIWVTAKFRSVTIAGERHETFLLIRTSFDGSTATIGQITVIRAVCANTIAAAYSDKRAMVHVRHTTKFDPAVAAKQLSDMAKSVETFKAIGDAMAQVEMTKEDISRFFKSVLDIPFDAKKEDTSTRKLNAFADMTTAYARSVREGAPQGSMWSALQAVTRYADHDRTVRVTDGTTESEARVVSSQLGSGAALKGKAMGLLLPLIKDRVAVNA